MTAKTNSGNMPRMALLVHVDMGVLSRLQSALADQGFTTIVARDLATALLAITQHHFDVAIVSSQLLEAGDGWPLAGVLHLVFPKAVVSVMAPSEPDVLTLQAAINYGVREVYEQAKPAKEVVGSIMATLESGVAGSGPDTSVIH